MIVLASAVTPATSHAYMYWPKSREALMEKGETYEDGKTFWGYPSAWSYVAHAKRGNHPFPYTVASKWGVGAGHAENEPFQDPSDFSGFLCNKIAPKRIAATYQEGGPIRIIIVQNAEHGGHHDFRICNKDWTTLKTNKEKAECLDMYLLGCDKTSDCGSEKPPGPPGKAGSLKDGSYCKCGHQCTPAKECGCFSDGCKTAGTNGGLKYDDPRYAHGPPLRDSLVHGSNVFDLTLPKGLSCEKCTLQWVWQTVRNGEQFANCADITIKPDPSKPKPTPAPPGPPVGSRRRSSRRRSPRRRSARRRGSRRRSTRRRTGSRRRPTRRRSKSRTSSATAGSQSRKYVDSSGAKGEYESYGCFPFSSDDDLAPGELEDMKCAKAPSSQKEPCRSGLPFYRFAATSVDECFSFCSSKGLDLFGLYASECRCGATQTNPVWHDFWPLVNDGLSLQLSTATSRNTGQCSGWRVYRDIGWLMGAPGEGLKVRSHVDATYIRTIIKGWAAKPDTPIL